MELRFKYIRDKLCRRLSAVCVLFILALFTAVFLLVTDGYMLAWLSSLLLAIVALYVLSIPRYISVDSENLEIHCVVEMTRIEISDIAFISKVETKRCSRTFPLLGSYGFFGYYGYYVDLRQWDIIKIYATERRNLIEIRDIFEQVYIVSCRDADTLIEAVGRAKKGLSVVDETAVNEE